MRRWLKALVVSCALFLISGAPGEADALQPRREDRPEVNRAPDQNSAAAANQAQQTSAPKQSPESTAASNPSVTAQDHQQQRSDQAGRREEEGGESYFVVAGYRLKITDFAIALFTGLLVLVGVIQAIRLRQTMIATKAAADALPILERAYVSLGIGLVPKITGSAQPPPAFAAAARRAGVPIQSIVKTRTRQVEEATAELGVVNYGKTPAFIYEISYAFAPIENPENIPPYPPSFIETEVVIKGGSAYGEPEFKELLIDELGEGNRRGTRRRYDPRLIKITTSGTQGEDIVNGRRFLIALARVRYRDIFGENREAAVCRLYDGRGDGTFAYHGGEQYNYRK